MLVAFSDLHLTDESTAINVNPEAFSNVLQKEIEHNYSRKGLQEIVLVLLGDIYDLVRTDYWLKISEDERPWFGVIDKKSGMNNKTKIIEKHYLNALELILKNRSSIAFIEMLNSIKRNCPDIPVKIKYVIGNHDRILNSFVSLQNRLKVELKEYDKDSIEFCNYFRSDDYSLFCRHGHEWDADNYGYQLYKLMNKKSKYEIKKFEPEVYKVQTIGEVITCELMSGIIHRIKDLNNKKFTDYVMNVNNVRPMTDAFMWLSWIGKGISESKEWSNKSLEVLLESFKESMRQLLKSSFSDKWDGIINEYFYFRGDITDRFGQLLEIIENFNFKQVSQLAEVLNSLGNMKDFLHKPKDDLLEGAKIDFSDPENKDIQYILYGHTHEARNDYIDGTVDGKVKMYINTGTFLPYVQKTLNGNGFASAHQLTMVYIFLKSEDTEKKGTVIKNVNQTLDLWNGIKRKDYTSI